MTVGILVIAYLAAGVLFIRALGGLSKQETARNGNLSGIIGMVAAIAVTAIAWAGDAITGKEAGIAVLAGTAIIGASIGGVLAKRVEMTGMPQLVAMLHSFVGAAAVLVGMSSYLAPHGVDLSDVTVRNVHMVEVWLGIFVGAVTFTGSVIAWGKLRGSISGRPLLLPGRHVLNALAIAAVIGLAVPFLQAPGESGLPYLLIMTGIACLVGVHLVMAIGGADMPVVVSLLNSYSGWAAAAAGFMLSNDLLIITGALVGSSGAILSIIMCRAMNRSILNVVFGGFGTSEGAAPAAGAAPAGDVHEIKPDAMVDALKTAKEVIIVPGYGMAVSRAQGTVQELTRTLREKGVNVRFAIHPVAGRLPGHMNVLLAEAGVPYDIVLEMEHINQDFPKTDVVMVIGANDIVNPAAETDKSSPIYGMPVLQVWNSKMVVVLKRGMAAGYAGVDNPLFYKDNARMLFGDARKSLEGLVSAVRT
ncbi:MAG: NAD(P)(+) transhydrogenase (Re/Si-specific) subunit beta [Myxococcaceae bacterium]